MKITRNFSAFLIACFSIFVFSANFAKAAEGDCHLVYCYVPAPTVLGPVLNQTISGRLAIIGLTWKTTIVKVFLDGQELANGYNPKAAGDSLLETSGLVNKYQNPVFG